MKGRYGVAAAFAVALALVLILRHEGYLHGRVEGGPLSLAAGGAGATLKPGQTAGFGLDVIVEGDAVQVQKVRGEFTSPGLRLLGPRRSDDRCGICIFRRWPPPDTSPLSDSDVERGTTHTLLGTRATSPGIYYVRNLVALYQRGAKSFRRTYGRDLCIVVTRHRRRLRCPAAYSPPSGAVIAEAGGPSRYDRPVVTVEGGEHAQATYPARAGRDTIAFTLSNLTDIGRTVSGLDAVVQFEGADIAVRQIRPERVAIPPHAGRRVRFEVVVEGCARLKGGAVTLSELSGEISNDENTVPLSVGLSFRAPRSCP
jgi:hypothetical protein